MSEFLCCKCFHEFDDEEHGACPVCDFTVCHGDCNGCNEEGSKKRYAIANIMAEENPFIQ